MMICPNLAQVFDEIVADLNYDTCCLCSTPKPYAAKTITGYVHTLPIGHGILVTDNYEPYLITNDMILVYELHTGDRIEALVDFSSRFARQTVISIEKHTPIVYETVTPVKATRHFSVKNHDVRLGTTALINTTENYDVSAEIDELLRQVPFGAQKIILAFDGRQENYPSDDVTLYLTKPAQTVRDKLTVCLLAFFRAKELASTGQDVVMVIDNLDKMFNIFNNCMQSKGVIDPNLIAEAAITDLESILCSSKALTTGGTFTILGLHHAGVTAPQKYINERLHQLLDVII